jgi:hypothetical protein
LDPHETRSLAGQLQLYYTKTCSKSLQSASLEQRNGIKNMFFLKSNGGHLVDFVLVELLAPQRPTIEVRGFLFLTSNERKASSSH